MNFETETDLLYWKQILRSEPILTQAVPLVLCIFLENKIARHYSLGKLHTLMAHALTGMLFANFVISYVQRPAFPAALTPYLLAVERDYAQFIALVGNLIYLSVFGCCMITILRV